MLLRLFALKIAVGGSSRSRRRRVASLGGPCVLLLAEHELGVGADAALLERAHVALVSARAGEGRADVAEVADPRVAGVEERERAAVGAADVVEQHDVDVEPVDPPGCEHEGHVAEALRAADDRTARRTAPAPGPRPAGRGSPRRAGARAPGRHRCCPARSVGRSRPPPPPRRGRSCRSTGCRGS